MLLGNTRTVAPTAWPFTEDNGEGTLVPTAELLEHLGEEAGVNDAYIVARVKAAVDAAEQYMNRALLTQTWEVYFGDPGARVVFLPMSPLQAVSKVERKEDDGTTVEIANTNWLAVPGIEPARLTLRANVSYWPYTANTLMFVATMTCGYTSAASIPAGIQQGLLLTLATWYAQREDVITGTIVNTLPQAATDYYEQYRVGRGVLL